MEQLATGYGLIEGPTWDPVRGLIFSDVINGGVQALATSGELTTVVPKRRGVGGIALHENGGLVLGGRDVIFQDFEESNIRVVSIEALNFFHINAIKPSGHLEQAGQHPGNRQVGANLLL